MICQNIKIIINNNIQTHTEFNINSFKINNFGNYIDFCTLHNTTSWQSIVSTMACKWRL